MTRLTEWSDWNVRLEIAGALAGHHLELEYPVAIDEKSAGNSVAHGLDRRPL